MALSPVVELAEALRRARMPLRSDPALPRLLLALVRLLAEGESMPLGRVRALAARLEVPPELLAPLLRQRAEIDDAGNIVGMMGLSLNRHPHRFEVNGRALSTWCAWDTLFLPSLLDQT